MQQTQTYRERSKVFLTKAWDELESRDLEQASEKGWGAGAMMIKAIGEQRGWEHHGHSQLLAIIRRLGQEPDGETVALLFLNADALHRNFYEDHLPAAAVRHTLAGVAEFVDKMDSLLDR